MGPVPSRIGVFLLAGNRLLREALGHILRKRQDFLVLGASADPSDVAAAAESEREVLLMDPATAPALNLHFLNSIRRSHPRMQIIMVGMDDRESMFLEAVRAGVTGYLLKDASAADVIAAIRSVSQNEAVCSGRLCRSLFRYVAEREPYVPSVEVNQELGLTRRQLELVPMIAKGFTNKEIAAHLNLSEQTVKNHIHRMLRKVGAECRLQVVEMATPRFGESGARAHVKGAPLIA